MRIFLVFWIASNLIACAAPMATIKSQAAKFRAQYPANFGYVQTDDGRIHYAWSGSKQNQALIFVHGSPGSWQGWAQFLLNEQLQKKFFIIAVDRPGYGGSGAGVAVPSLNKQAEVVAKILALNQSNKKPVLVGHSFGGPVIAELAMLHPEKVGALVFVASSVSPALEKTKWFQYPASWWPFKHLIPTDLRVCNEEIFELKKELEQQEGRWALVQSKVAIVHGLSDELVPKENADYLIAVLRKDQILFIERVPSQGHFIPWERPDLIEKAIEAVAFSSN